MAGSDHGRDGDYEELYPGYKENRKLHFIICTYINMINMKDYFV